MQTEHKICNWQEAAFQVRQWQQQGEEVVFTNGVFDIVHLGHIDYLEKARNLGQRLVIGVNSDASVRRFKGDKRPVVPQYARLRMMAALAFTDLVVLFEEDTPLELITHLGPDVLVKGNDYTVATIVGADIVLGRGGRVETIQLVDGYSTTVLIQKIKERF
jgi:rfaE bifunctional protein nucleotidyltransferase chain/domain